MDSGARQAMVEILHAVGRLTVSGGSREVLLDKLRDSGIRTNSNLELLSLIVTDEQLQGWVRSLDSLPVVKIAARRVMRTYGLDV